MCHEICVTGAGAQSKGSFEMRRLNKLDHLCVWLLSCLVQYGISSHTVFEGAENSLSN